MKKLIILCVTVALLLAACSQSDAEARQSEPATNAGGTPSVSDDWNEEWGDPAQATLEPDAPPAATHDLDVGKPTGDVVEITEKLFIAQTNDIYLNPEDYLGKTIKYEGVFDAYYHEPADETYYYVIRYGPGCCGYDANAGFEVEWDGEYPKSNDWVEATGVLEAYEEDENSYLRLDLSSLEVLDVRGAEYVSQ